MFAGRNVALWDSRWTDSSHPSLKDRYPLSAQYSSNFPQARCLKFRWEDLNLSELFPVVDREADSDHRNIL